MVAPLPLLLWRCGRGCGASCGGSHSGALHHPPGSGALHHPPAAAAAPLSLRSDAPPLIPYAPDLVVEHPDLAAHAPLRLVAERLDPAASDGGRSWRRQHVDRLIGLVDGLTRLVHGLSFFFVFLFD
jgi:hypothetical protein